VHATGLDQAGDVVGMSVAHGRRSPDALNSIPPSS
jgi:hypothetical protein